MHNKIAFIYFNFGYYISIMLFYDKKSSLNLLNALNCVQFYNCVIILLQISSVFLNLKCKLNFIEFGLFKISFIRF